MTLQVSIQVRVDDNEQMNKYMVIPDLDNCDDEKLHRKSGSQELLTEKTICEIRPKRGA